MYRCPNTGYIVQAHDEDGTTAKEAPQTYHALSCIARAGTHLVDPATGEVLVPRETARVAQFVSSERLSRSGTKLLFFSYRGSLRLPLRRKARAVLPSVEAVCTGCWLVKIEPAIMPTRNAPVKMSIIRPTGCGDG
jgi:hypothetical protein